MICSSALSNLFGQVNSEVIILIAVVVFIIYVIIRSIFGGGKWQ